MSVIILNWNGWEDTIQCLESVFKSSYPDYKVIVIDNGSTNNSVGKITQWAQNQRSVMFSSSSVRDISRPFLNYDADLQPYKGQAVETRASDLILICSHKNLGFAGGNNIGIRHALKDGVDYVVLLNNDTIVTSFLLKDLSEVMEQDQKTGIVGCKVLEMDSLNRIQHGAENRMPWLGFRVKNLKFTSGVIDVNFISGCLMLVRTEVFNDIGLLNEKYFMYMEDVDFCHQARMAGWKLKVNLDSAIWHKVSASNKDKGFTVTYYSARNRLHLIKWRLKGIKRIAAFISFFEEQLLRILRVALKGNFNMVIAIFRGNLDFIRGCVGKKEESVC